MIQYTKYCLVITLLLVLGSCKKKEYTMGNLTAPTNVTINTNIVGKDATHPDGDGSGNVDITLTGDNVLAYHIDYDASDGIKLNLLPSGKTTYQFVSDSVKTFRITVVAYGPGATSTTVTKDIRVRFIYDVDQTIVNNLVGSGSKTWRVDKTVAGHFGVGPWESGSVTPSWWSAGVNEKVACCNCFYTATYTFAKGSNGYTLTVAAPDGAFTKTGDLANGLPGIPASGDEACYGGYTGGTSSFIFLPSKSGVAASAPSTKVAIALGGSNTYIGYGAVQKVYEIMSIDANYMYLRVQGTETGNAWYLKLKAE
jgi:protein involved in ribonucleotide reduction